MNKSGSIAGQGRVIEIRPREGYRLYYPIEPIQQFSDESFTFEINANGLDHKIQGTKTLLIVDVSPFQDIESAVKYIPHMWNVLASVSLSMRTGFLLDVQPRVAVQTIEQSVVAKLCSDILGSTDKPLRSGHSGPNSPSIESLGGIHAHSFVGRVTLSVGISHNRFVEHFCSAIEGVERYTGFHDKGVRVALELFKSVLTESSMESRFVSCVVGLEALSERRPKHAIAQGLVDRLGSDIDSLMQSQSLNDEEMFALESLKRELVFRREESLRSGIRRLILETFPDLPDDQKKALAKKVVDAYDLRGTLVHDGTIDYEALSQNFQVAYDALRGVLEKRLQQT